MKKIMLSLAVIMGLGFAQINAQTIKFGAKLEGNMSNFILSDMDGMSSNFGFRASVGGFAKFEISEYFAVQPELLFHFKNSTLKTEGIIKTEADYQYLGLEVPIYAVGQIKLGNGIGYIGVGPYVGFGIDAQSKPEIGRDVDLYEKGDITDKAAMQRWDVGAGVMLGYEFDCGLQINAGYKIGFINTLDLGSDDSSMLNQTISLGVGFRF